jgi:hypothetical protein
LVARILQPWRCRQYVPLKPWWTATIPCEVSSQKTVLFILATVRTFFRWVFNRVFIIETTLRGWQENAWIIKCSGLVEVKSYNFPGMSEENQ